MLSPGITPREGVPTPVKMNRNTLQGGGDTGSGSRQQNEHCMCEKFQTQLPDLSSGSCPWRHGVRTRSRRRRFENGRNQTKPVNFNRRCNSPRYRQTIGQYLIHVACIALPKKIYPSQTLPDIPQLTKEPANRYIPHSTPKSNVYQPLLEGPKTPI